MNIINLVRTEHNKCIVDYSPYFPFLILVFYLILKIDNRDLRICISSWMIYKSIIGECGSLICKMSWETSTIALGVHMVACATPPPHYCCLEEFVPSLVLVQTKIKMCDYFLVSNKFPNPCSMLELLLRRWLSRSLSFSIRMDFIKNMLVKSWIDSVLMYNYFLSYLIYGWLISYLICDCSFDSYILSQ